MAKKKEVSEDLRLCIVNAHKEGKGYKAISKQFRVPVATIQSIIRKYKEFHTVKKTLKDVVGSQRCRLVWQEKYGERPTTIHGSLLRLS